MADEVSEAEREAMVAAWDKRGIPLDDPAGPWCFGASLRDEFEAGFSAGRVYNEGSLRAANEEIEQLTDALERHKRLIARYRKPMPEGGLTSSEKLHTSHVARVDAEARAEQAEAQVKKLREALATARRRILRMYGAGFDSRRREIATDGICEIDAALASSEPKGNTSE